MENSLDVVTVRIEQEGRVIAGMVGPLSRPTIVAAAGGQPGLMEQPDGLLVLRLKCQMHVARLALILSQRVDPEFIAGDVPVVVSQKRNIERSERCAIEIRRGREIPGPQLDMVDQTASVQYHVELPEWRTLPIWQGASSQTIATASS